MSGGPADPAAGALALLAWRRRVAAVYAAVRADPDPAHAWAGWRAARDELLATTPVSPVPAARRAAGPVAVRRRLRPGLAGEVPLDPDVEPDRREVPTGTDGTVAFERVGLLRTPWGDLDVWALRSYGGGLFVPVRDATAGRTSYGGGRYLLDTVKGADLGGGGPAYRRRHAGRRPELPLRAVVRLRPGLGLPAGPAGQRARRPGRCRRAAPRRRLVAGRRGRTGG